MSASRKRRILDVENEEAMADELPDELIIALVSLLPLKEAGRCGVLSRRWKDLWRFFSRRLDFDASKTLREMKCGLNRDTDAAARAYVSWVNQVLKLHQAPSVDGLRICFSLDNKYSSDIDGWIDFAMQKRVKSFELDLSCFTRWIMGDCYNFSSKVSTSASGFSSLKDLRLVHIRVGNEVMDHFLSNCPLLEHLSLEGLESLSDLRISGKTPVLKRLEVIRCRFLEIFEVSAVKLVSCTYVGNYIGIPFKNVPLLSELFVGNDYCKSVLISSSQHSSYLPQIKNLKIKPPYNLTQLASICPKLELYHLTELELYFLGHMGENLIYYTSLIKASPILRRFTVKLVLGETAYLGMIKGWLASYQEAREATRCCHKNLKLIEMKDFVGCESDFELALHLLEVAVSLEKIVIEPIDADVFRDRDRARRLQARARNSARKLQPKLRPGSELVIL